MGKELYVGHLSEKVTEEDLRKLFAVVGRVTSIHLIVDPDTKEFKRCGYVRMASEEEAKEAIDTLDGALLIDRVITVSISRPQKQVKPGGAKGRPRPGNRPRGKGSSGRP